MSGVEAVSKSIGQYEEKIDVNDIATDGPYSRCLDTSYSNENAKNIKCVGTRLAPSSIAYDDMLEQIVNRSLQKTCKHLRH